MFDFVSLTVAANATNPTLPTNIATAFTGAGANTIIPFAGSALVGYCIGFALKKILKWTLIILGVLAGIVFMAIQWMSQNGYIRGPIAWDKLGNDTALYAQHLVTTTNIHNAFHYLGIPMTGGLGIGLLTGFIRTR